MLTYPIGLLSPKGSIPENGLIGEWLFSGNANDTSGYGNNGTVNGATLTTDRKGASNSAYLFSGAEDITLGNLNSIFTDKTRISISYWVYGATGSYHIISFYNSSSDRFVTVWNTSDVLQLLPFNSTTGQGTRTFTKSTVWYHVVHIYDGNEALDSNKIKIYINSNLQSITIQGGAVATSLSNTFASDSRIGSQAGAAYANGKIDDIRLYNRILTQDEITTLYNE